MCEILKGGWAARWLNLEASGVLEAVVSKLYGCICPKRRSKISQRLRWCGEHNGMSEDALGS